MRGRSELPSVLALELAAIIERRIIYLEIQPDAHLTEQDVCDEFGVSRSPVREAFRQLEASGLVVRLARRGVRVTPMTEEDLAEIYFCRIPLEGRAAAAATKHATQADLDFLQSTLGLMAVAMAEDRPRDFFDRNVEFLNRVHLAAGNKMLLRILTIIEKQALRYRYLAHSSTRQMLDVSYNGLAAMNEGIRSGKANGARKAATSVMKEAELMIADALRQRRIAPPSDRA
jgi:DNA-binding GntR family transcriptional regulator